MKTLNIRRAAIAFAALVAFTPATFAANIPILGAWEIVESQPAPWTKPQEQAALAAAGKRLHKLVVTFGSSSVESKYKLLTCKSRVLYEPNQIDVDAIFEGNLPEPNPTAAAARLGFPKGDIPGMDVRCLKERFVFHFRDPNTALVNLGGVIYTLKRR